VVSNPPPPSPDFTIILDSSSLSAQQSGVPAQLTVTVNPLNGFTGTVTVSFSNLPAGIIASPTGSFSVVAGQSQLATLSASGAASIAIDAITLQGVSGAQSHVATLTLRPRFI
jgi:hypothetical protein